MTTTIRPGAKHALLLLLVAVLALLALARPAPASASVRGHSKTYIAWHYALAHRGDPYVWAGAGPGGFDCSGLVMAAYRDAGIQLPHNTVAMLDSGMLVRTSHPTPGVLAFYGSGHVELWDRPGVTYGAEKPGTTVGFHTMSTWWHATAFYRVRGAG
jgi:cell wall-associated NlpC family hydrolase